MSFPAELKEVVSEQVPGGQVLAASSVSGGSISSAWQVELQSGERCFLKANQVSLFPMFQSEVLGLQELRAANAVAVPEVITLGQTENFSYLVLEYLPEGASSAKAEVELGHKLATQHRVTAEQYGFQEDNYIGRLQQKNTFSNSWMKFFFTERLGFQAELGRQAGWFTRAYEDAVEHAAERARDDFAEFYESPALLHGDLWGGNILYSEGTPYLIDPAVYYGSREADVAFTELFGGFGPSFYRAYNDAYPLQEGYERRKVLLNTYHYMTHANMFGGSYPGGVLRSLQAYAESDK